LFFSQVATLINGNSNWEKLESYKEKENIFVELFVKQNNLVFGTALFPKIGFR